MSERPKAIQAAHVKIHSNPCPKCGRTEIHKVCAEVEKLCEKCGQPIKPGRHKADEYRHAQGCPNDRSKYRKLPPFEPENFSGDENAY